MKLLVTRLVEDQGTIVVFEGQPGVSDEPEPAVPGGVVWFGADWRPARDIVYALEHGEEVIVNVEPWQLLGGMIAAHDTLLELERRSSALPSEQTDGSITGRASND